MGKLLLPNQGLTQWLDKALAEAFLVGLIGAPIDVDKNTTLADVEAVESTFPGYSRQGVADTNWTPPVLVGDVAKSITDHFEFAFVGGPGDGEDVYGWFLTENGGGIATLRAVLVFDPDPPVPINLANPIYTLILAYGMFSQYTT